MKDYPFLLDDMDDGIEFEEFIVALASGTGAKENSRIHWVFAQEELAPLLC